MIFCFFFSFVFLFLFGNKKPVSPWIWTTIYKYKHLITMKIGQWHILILNLNLNSDDNQFFFLLITTTTILDIYFGKQQTNKLNYWWQIIKKDINTVQGVNEHIIITQEAKTRDTCKNIVNDLTSPEGNVMKIFFIFSIGFFHYCLYRMKKKMF